MMCWTRLFRKRLLPLLLAAVMLTGMLPRLTVVAQAEEQGRKIDLTESSVSHYGTTADNTRPKRWVVDGDRTQANYFVTGNDQTQTANTENPANPGYWLQLDLGQKYSITKLNLCIYYDGRYLKDLVVLASNEAEFTKENSQVVYNADSNNFFGLGVGTDLEMPAQNNSAGFDITPTPVVEAQYLRIFNNGNSKNDGAHWIEVEVYGTETTGQPMLYNVANGRKATVNKDGSVDPNRPASLMTDGDKSVGQYTEISRDKVQDKNDPSYAQIDLGDVYPISRVNFWNYWADGRTLKNLKIILSEDPHFNNATTIYSQDYTATEQGLAATPENPVRARYIRVWNDGHDKGNGGHYIEIEAWSTETQRPVQPEPFQFGGILNIPTYTANGKDGEGVTHPDVLDFTQIKDTGGAALDTWGGYRYWMAMTPNQTGNSQFENPCLAASSDGITWVVPTGITNPLTNVPREPDNTHNCDTDMIYDPNSDQLWVYYIWEQDSPRGTPSELRRIKVGYSEGNFTVGQYEVCTKSSYQYDMQSPAVVRRGAGQWLMWSNNSDQNDGVAGWQNQNAFVELRQSQDGKTWGAAKSLKQSLILKGEGGVEYYIPWHLDVQWVESENEYWGLFCAYPKGGNTQRTYLLFATSADGEMWTSYPKPLISPTDGGWYNNFVYRSTFTYENGKLRVWFSGGESQGWRIGYTEFDSFKTTVLPTLGTAYTPDAPTPPQPGNWRDVTPGSGDILFDPYTAANDGWKVENDTDAASYRKGSKATFCFYGTAVQWIGQQEDCFGPAVLYLDGNPVAEGDIKNQYISSGNNHDVILFTAESLENKAHVLTIEPKNDGLRTPTGGGPRPHDGVQITKLQYKGPEKGQAPDGLYSVEIDQTDIPVGGTARITALAPFNSASSVSYESADKNIATVSTDGIVTGVGAGQTTITVKHGSDSKEVAVTVTAGQLNTWVRVDSHDGRISYTGSWIDENSSGHYQGKAKEAKDAPGAAASFTFTGTGFRWIGQMDSNYGLGRVYVDGKLVAIGDANAPSGNPLQAMILELRGLPEGQHTVKVEAESGAPIQVDAFEYYNGTLDTTVSSVVIHPSAPILLEVNESIGVLATAMHGDRVAVLTDQLEYAVEADTLAKVDASGAQPMLIGLAAGQGKLIARLKNDGAKSAERAVTVLSGGMQETPRMPVDKEHPLLLVSIYAQTKKQDWWEAGKPAGIPSQGNLSVTGIWNNIPDDLKPYTAIQLHADDFVGHGYGGYGDHDRLWAWYSYFVDQAEEYNRNEPDSKKHINIYLTLMTGGTPLSYLSRTIPDDELVAFINTHECVKGVVLSENYNNGDTVGVAKVTAKYLKLMAQQGCYLVLTDIDKPGSNMMEKWFNDTDELHNAAKKYHKYLIINSKSTSSSGFNTVRSFAVGAWLAGLADNWGALTDAWAWYESGYGQLFKPNSKPSYEDVRRVYTFPETLFAMNMLQCYANGAVVFNAEHPFYCTGVDDKPSWVLKESILPAFRYIVQHPAADKDTVANQIKAGIFTNGGYLPQNYAAGLYGNHTDTNILQSTGRYRVLPLFTKYVQSADLATISQTLSISDFSGKSEQQKQDMLAANYPARYQGTAFAEELLGGGHRWLVMNSSFNENTNQSANITPMQGSFATKLEFTLTPHTYLISSETADALEIELNNFRADKDELWVSGKSLNNVDWATVSPDGSWNGDNQRHVTEYMAYHIENPQLDKRDGERHDLRDTVIKVTSDNPLTASVERLGEGSKKQDAFYTEKYEAGVYTLTITHNGQVRVAIRAKATAPALPDIAVSQKYTVTTGEKAIGSVMPADAGTLTYTKGTESKTGSVTVTSWAVDSTGKVTYTLSNGAAGNTVTLPVIIGSDNYADATVNVVITLTAKDDQAALTLTGGTTVVYGQTLQLGTSGGSGTGAVTYAVTNGTGKATIDASGKLTPVKVGTVKVKATKAADASFNEATSAEVEITITRATPTGAPKYTAITTSGKTLADAGLTLTGSTLNPNAGTLVWVDNAGNVLPGTTAVAANTTYKWLFTPADANYTTLTGFIELYHKSSSGGGGWYYTYYTIKATAGTNGSISPSGWTSVRDGRDQTFTITPDKGYAVAKVLVDGKSVGAVKSYTFKNVTKDHTIEAIFMKSNGNPQTGVFVDVAEGSYYEEAIDWAVEKGITNGVSSNMFAPNDPCTRAQIVTFLWRAAGSPAPKSMSSFTDVPADAFYAKAVAWAVENGITSGTGEGKFSPNATCTRAQAVTFLYRASGSPAVSGSAEFSDVSTTAFYADAVTWAAKKGITTGIGGGLFGSDNDCTRGQIVTFLWRAMAE